MKMTVWHLWRCNSWKCKNQKCESKCPASICFDTTEAMLLLYKELKPNMVWGLWPETKCGIFLKNNFFFFLLNTKAQKLFSFFLHNSVQITHFFRNKTFSFQGIQITNTKPSTKIYIQKSKKKYFHHQIKTYYCLDQ